MSDSTDTAGVSRTRWSCVLADRSVLLRGASASRLQCECRRPPLPPGAHPLGAKVIDVEDMDAAAGDQSSLDEPPARDAHIGDSPSDQVVEIYEENDKDDTRAEEAGRVKHLPKKSERRASQEYYDILYGKLCVPRTKSQWAVQPITRITETNRSKFSPPGRSQHSRSRQRVVQSLRPCQWQVEIIEEVEEEQEKQEEIEAQKQEGQGRRCVQRGRC